MKKIFYILLLCISNYVAFAQGGGGVSSSGFGVDFEINPVCYGDTATYWAVMAKTAATVTTTYFDKSGTIVTPLLASLKIGACQKGDYEYQIQPICNGGVTALMVFIYKDGVVQPITYLTPTGTAYTPVGSYTLGTCNDWAVTTYTATSASTTGSVSIAAGKQSITVTNVGVGWGIINGVSVPPNYTMTFQSYEDPVLRKWNNCPAVSLNATGTTFIYTTTP